MFVKLWNLHLRIKYFIYNKYKQTKKKKCTNLALIFNFRFLFFGQLFLIIHSLL